VAEDQGRPFSVVLETLAKFHPEASFRQRLLRVRNEMEHGEDVWDCLRAVDLVTSAESSVLETARRAGNQEWALRFVARRHTRRQLQRWARWREVISTLAILVVCAIIGSTVLILFSSLPELVWRLV